MDIADCTEVVKHTSADAQTALAETDPVAAKSFDIAALLAQKKAAARAAAETKHAALQVANHYCICVATALTFPMKSSLQARIMQEMGIKESELVPTTSRTAAAGTASSASLGSASVGRSVADAESSQSLVQGQPQQPRRASNASVPNPIPGAKAALAASAADRSKPLGGAGSGARLSGPPVKSAVSMLTPSRPKGASLSPARPMGNKK
jgi:hypothetical protein